MAVQTNERANREKKPRNRWVSDIYPHEVYFVRAIGLDLIKIGYAADAQSRYRSIVTCCPVECQLMGTLSSFKAAELEKEWHRRFNKLRVRGEWFRAEPALVNAISVALKGPRDDAAVIRAAMQAAYPNAAP